jgi:hypothetical protein
MVDKAQPKLGVQLGPVGVFRAAEQRDDIADRASHRGDLLRGQAGRADASKRSEACPGRELAGLGLGDPDADDGRVAAAIESGPVGGELPVGLGDLIAQLLPGTSGSHRNQDCGDHGSPARHDHARHGARPWWSRGRHRRPQDGQSPPLTRATSPMKQPGLPAYDRCDTSTTSPENSGCIVALAEIGDRDSSLLEGKMTGATPDNPDATASSRPAGFRLYTPPPAGFDPVRASDRELLAHGYPARPDQQRQPELHQHWTAMLSRPMTVITPRFEVMPERLGGRRLRYADTVGTGWAGTSLITPAGGDPVTFVSGQWTVPAVVPPQGDHGSSACATWIGIDGNGEDSPDILQTGTTVPPAGLVGRQDSSGSLLRTGRWLYVPLCAFAVAWLSYRGARVVLVAWMAPVAGERIDDCRQINDQSRAGLMSRLGLGAPAAVSA